MTFLIRQSTTDAEDASMLALLMHESVHGVAQSAYSARERAAWSPEPRGAEQARDRFAGQHVWIAEDGQGPCAFMTLKSDGYLDFAYAVPRAVGRGAAALLYDALEAWASVQGHAKLTSDVSLVARPFFENRGWRVLRKQENVRGGVTLINFRMEKDLYVPR